MADTILNELNASKLFDLQGVVAVVTGGGTVSSCHFIKQADNECLQGIGMMIGSTLVANGATVYIIGPKQEDLDRYSYSPNVTTNGFNEKQGCQYVQPGVYARENPWNRR